jgi:hypothetical protein
MRLPTLLSALLAATAPFASASDAAATRTAAIYIQPLTSPETAPSLLAEIAIPDPQPDTDSAPDALPTPAEVLSYSAPDLPDQDEQQNDRLLLRIGIYDPHTKTWVSSTSLASASNFAKGYAPHFVLSLDSDSDSDGEGGNVLGVVCRGVAIDAGVTRDFGPQAAVARTQRGAQPVLGKPVVLGEGGRRVGEEGERSFLQKYVAVLSFLLVLAVLRRCGAFGVRDGHGFEGLDGGCANRAFGTGTGGFWRSERSCCFLAGETKSDRLGYQVWGLGNVISTVSWC